jgi:hypothetical protein
VGALVLVARKQHGSAYSVHGEEEARVSD